MSDRSDEGLNAPQRSTRQNCEQMWPSEVLFIAEKENNSQAVTHMHTVMPTLSPQSPTQPHNNTLFLEN